MRTLIVVAVITFAAVQAVAEVTPSGIVLTPRGPWTVETVPTSRTLNADGDVNGDGAPAFARPVVAWLAPSSSSLEVARWDGTEWRDVASIAVDAAFGVPAVAELGGTVVIAWTQYPDRPEVHGVVIVAGEHSEPVRFSDGHLVDVVALSRDTFAIVARTLAGRLDVITVEHVIPPLPIILGRIDVDTVAVLSLSVTHDPRVRYSGPVPVLTWWRDPYTLGAAVLTDGGPLPATWTSSSTPYDPALVSGRFRNLERAGLPARRRP